VAEGGVAVLKTSVVRWETQRKRLHRGRRHDLHLIFNEGYSASGDTAEIPRRRCCEGGDPAGAALPCCGCSRPSLRIMGLTAPG